MSKLYDCIDGYRLEVGPTWYEYSPDQRAALCNGVGSEDQPQWQLDLLARLPYLLPASRPHDIDYYSGGSSEDRLAADKRFRRNCLRVAKAHIGGFWSRLFRAPTRARWLMAHSVIQSAYLALRIWGRNHYNYTAMQEAAVEHQ